MRKTAPTISLLAALVFAGSACAQGHGASLGEESIALLANGQGQTTAPRSANFVTVEGADLSAKLDAAARQARASAPKTPYWTAYSFDVRPGVAVDPGGGEFHGSMDTVGGIHVFVGTTRSGMTAETRNLALFVLRDPTAGGVTRMEIYNLDRQREYSGYPVYFAGRAANEESLAYLRPFVEQTQTPRLQERAALAVALHDDRRVADTLKNFIRASKNERVRSTAAFWLGQTGGETEFLAGLVRNDQETVDLRRVAAHAIGASRDAAALTTLQSLYNTVAPKDVKRGIIHAVSDNENREAAYTFLLKVAQTDPDRDARRTSVHLIGESGRDVAVDDLMKIFSADRDEDVRRTVIHALSELGTPRADAKLLELARTADDADLRRAAIHQLGERNTEAMVDELMKLYAQETNTDVKRHILHAFSEMESPRAQSRIVEIARDQTAPADVRRHAVHLLGERGESAFDELARLLDTDRSQDVRRQILHAFSEMDSQRAEDKLFEVARRSEDRELRKQAIHWIGEKASQKSLDFLKETVNSNSADTEVQMQAVHAISEKPTEQAVPLLIQVAKTHPNQQVRRAAIHWLGESGDPRALEFFREVLSK
jgi:HEAT repeat protein